MIEHLVLVKFSDETTKNQKLEAVKRLNEMKEKISEIIELKAGLNFSMRNQGYDLGVTVQTQNLNALETYLKHPEHEAVKNYLKKIGHIDTIALDFFVGA
ncbi:MAG TPA: stress protein [Candidatus Atribacteria bacterium]|nr:stress protein [Candidatus Atribacteria bacterium]